MNPCPTEDSVNCVWNAQLQGNHIGHSFVAYPPTPVVVYVVMAIAGLVILLTIVSSIRTATRPAPAPTEEDYS